MKEIYFTAPSIEQIDFKKTTNFEEIKNDIALNIDVQNTEPVLIGSNEYYYGLKIIISGDDAPFSLSLQLSANFSLDKEDSVNATKVLEKKGTEILYSYARPLITDVLVKAGLPPLTIPYMNN